MSVEIITTALQSNVEGATHRFVLVILADAAGPEGYTWLSVPTIAKRTGLSVSSVRRALRYLEEAGAIRSAVRWDEVRGDRTSNAYWVDAVTLGGEQLADPRDHPYASLFAGDPRRRPPGHSDRTPRSQGPDPPVTVTA